MDPNATLARIREIIATPRNWNIWDNANTTDAEELAELVTALDQWISGGGFLPCDWSANTTAPRLGYTGGGFR
jgi:hypothetical protein